MLLFHPFTHTFTHQWRLAATQGTNQLVRSIWGLGVLLKNTSTCPGWDRTGNPPTARQQLLPFGHKYNSLTYCTIYVLFSNTSIMCHCLTYWTASLLLKCEDDAGALMHINLFSHSCPHIRSSDAYSLSLSQPPTHTRTHTLSYSTHT